MSELANSIDFEAHDNTQMLLEIVNGFPVNEDAKAEVYQATEDHRIREGLRQIEEYDAGTYRHVIQVGLLSAHLALRDIDNRSQIETLTKGAIIHDLGKPSIDIKFINPSPGPEARINRLDRENDPIYQAIKPHPVNGFKIAHVLFGNNSDLVDPEAELIEHLILTHHRYDESQKPYPDIMALEQLQKEGLLNLQRLKDNQALHLLGKYLAVADVYEAITSGISGRSYREEGEFDNPNKVVSALLAAHPTMESQIEELMAVHQARFPELYISQQAN